MTTFLDGPAKGQCLMLRCSPEILRVVHDVKTGKWDALDLPTDTPRHDEEVYTYKLKRHIGSAFICRRPGGGGLTQIAEYEYQGEE